MGGFILDEVLEAVVGAERVWDSSSMVLGGSMVDEVVVLVL